MPAAAALAAAGVLGGGANNTNRAAAQAYFDQQSPEDQAAIRASWNTPGQGGIAIGGSGFTARPGSRLGDGVMMTNWYNNANAAGAIPPPPPVAPPPGPAQTAPVAGPVQPAPQPASTASLRPAPTGQPAGGSSLPQPGSNPNGGYAGGVHTQPPPPQTSTPGRQPEWGGNVAAGATPIANMMTNNFAQPKKPFDYETAKNQFGAAEAKRLESESR